MTTFIYNSLWPRFFVVVLAILVISGCAASSPVPATPVGDGGLLNTEDKSCAPPCFWDITPGVSTEADLNKMLQARSIGSVCTAFDSESQGGTRGIECTGGPVFIFRQGSSVVSDLGIDPTVPVTVGEVINARGDPDAVLVTQHGLPEDLPQPMSMILYFDDIMATLVLPEQRADSFQIQPDTPVVNIGYSDRFSYDRSRKYSSEWHGYGEYELLFH